MKRPVYLCLSACILNCCCIIKTQTTCVHPDVPENGSYTSEQSNFELGDEITYSCQNGFALSGKNRRRCTRNGQWSDHTPFCDPAIQLTDPVSHDPSGEGSRVMDGDTNTCVVRLLSEDKYIKVSLARKIIIRTVKIFFKKGPTSIQIFSDSNQNKTPNVNYEDYLERDQWIVINLRSNELSDSIKLAVTENGRFTVCEIEVYGNMEYECENPPDKEVSNGYFEVSRSIARLVCEDGYKSKFTRLICEENEWRGSQPLCEEILCSLELNFGLSPGSKWKFVDPVPKISVGTRRQLICDNGYKKIGDPDVTVCQWNGEWTKTNATCVEKIGNRSTIIYVTAGIIATLNLIALLGVIYYCVKKKRDKHAASKQSLDVGGILSGSDGDSTSSVYYEIMLGIPPVHTTPFRPLPVTSFRPLSQRLSGGAIFP